MNEAPADDVDRFNRLIALAKRGLLTEEEEAHIQKVHWAARWGTFTQAYWFILAALTVRTGEMFGRKANGYNLQVNGYRLRYFSPEEREKIDAILAAHQSPDHDL